MTGKQLSLIVAAVMVVALAAVASYLGIDLDTLLGAVETTQGMTE